MEAQQFVSTGPYQWIRHPIYTAFLLILGSILLISANWFIGGLWIILTAVDIWGRIRFEEEKLQARFGEAYGRYLQTTGALLPRFRK
jgi:protein-S-isoprenylcysteine O-methyltransferase Ste14